MNRINWSRVIVGGLVAGAVLNLGEWALHELVLKAKMEEAVSQMGMELPTGSDIGIFVAMTFVLGILLVWLYAAIRPRYGPGPRAAIISAMVGWVLLYAFWFCYNLAWELFPQNIVTISTVWGFFELPLATIVGAWLYREEPAVAARASL